MKGRIVRIDKTARQKGTPSWVKELLYVDEVDDAKPTDKSDATSEGSVRDRELPKSNAERATEHGNDLAFFSLRKITEKARSAVAKTLDRLFLGLMDRSMGETNFFVVTMMGLACSKVISAQFFEAEAFGELNLLAFLIAICTAAVFTASKKTARKPACRLVHFRASGIYRDCRDMRSSRAQFIGRVRAHHGILARLRSRRSLFGRRAVFSR